MKKIFGFLALFFTSSLFAQTGSTVVVGGSKFQSVNTSGTQTVGGLKTFSSKVTISPDAGLQVGTVGQQSDAANSIDINQGSSAWALTIRNTNSAGRVLKVVGNSSTAGDAIFDVRQNTSSETSRFFVDPFANVTIGTNGGTVSLARNNSEPTLYVNSSSGSEFVIRSRGSDTIIGTSNNTTVSFRQNNTERIGLDTSGVVKLANFIQRSESNINVGGTTSYPELVPTTSHVKMSSASAGFTIHGIQEDLNPSQNGLELIIVNVSGQTMTIAHNSGSATGALNRIFTNTGANVNVPNDGSALLVYSGDRWRLVSP